MIWGREMNKKFIMIILWIAILSVSGCLQTKEKEPNVTTAIPTITTPTTATPTAIQTSTAVSTPIPKELNPNTFYVVARIQEIFNWGNNKYEVRSWKAEITNQNNIPFTIKAQVLNNEQVLEERSFILEHDGSSYAFVNDKGHFINGTNLTLKLLIPGYQPLDYKFGLD